jgi:hypothetical protein
LSNALGAIFLDEGMILEYEIICTNRLKPKGNELAIVPVSDYTFGVAVSLVASTDWLVAVGVPAALPDSFALLQATVPPTIMMMMKQINIILFLPIT